MKVDFTLEELIEIRGSIGSMIDIVDEELDDPKNKQDLDFARGKWLTQHGRCVSILRKVSKAIEGGK